MAGDVWNVVFIYTLCVCVCVNFEVKRDFDDLACLIFFRLQLYLVVNVNAKSSLDDVCMCDSLVWMDKFKGVEIVSAVHVYTV